MREEKKWTWHILAAIVILFLLGLHMIIMHLDAIVGIFSSSGAKPTDWKSVIERAKNMFFVVTYIVLLAAALYHGLYGFRNILFELNLKQKGERVINVLFVISGFLLFAFGSYVVIATFLLKITV